MAKKAAKKKGSKKKFWIAGAIKKPGAYRRQKGVKKGETIAVSTMEADAKKGGTIGARARLALKFRKFRKGRKGTK